LKWYYIKEAEMNIRSKYVSIFIIVILITLSHAVFAQKLLIPMDSTQNDHLRAYGLVYWCLDSPRHYKAEWLLNYRGGSFLVDDGEDVREKANIMGVSIQPVSLEEVNAIYQIIDANNMDVISLEKAPKIAVYKPIYEVDGDSFKLATQIEPWDDAVQLALDYAGIKYDIIYFKPEKNGNTGKITEPEVVHHS
jgi:hypothetical protein